MTAAKNNKALQSKKNVQLLSSHENGKSEKRIIAENCMAPTTINALTIRSFNKIIEGTGLKESIEVMQENAHKISVGDISELEALLSAQSSSLDTIFNELARRAAVNLGQHLNATEIYMRMALKVQLQCVRTVEALVALKNPPIVYAKQANIAHGNQQVNNNIQNFKETSAQNEKIQNQPNELLEVKNGSKKMDCIAARQTSRND